MADTLEDRVSRLEREMATVKDRVEVIDKDMQTLPQLINTQFRFMESRFARVLTEMDELRNHTDARFAEMRAHIDAKFDAVMRGVAEIVAGKNGQD